MSLSFGGTCERTCKTCSLTGWILCEMNIIGLLSHRNIDKQKDSIHAMRESNFYQLSFEAETTFGSADFPGWQAFF